jgi:hypothetical protein
LKDILNKIEEMQRKSIRCFAIELGEFLLHERKTPDTEFNQRNIDN